MASHISLLEGLSTALKVRVFTLSEMVASPCVELDTILRASVPQMYVEPGKAREIQGRTSSLQRRQVWENLLPIDRLVEFDGMFLNTFMVVSQRFFFFSVENVPKDPKLRRCVGEVGCR